MVAFTSPNFGWLDSMRKNKEAHCKLYMPVWELGELWEAVSFLSLNINLDVLIERYKQFGGVPRICFRSDADEYQEELNELDEAIEKIKTFNDVQACFEKSMPMNLVAHRLLHYIPMENPRFATLRFGSDFIGRQIYARLNTKLSQERAKLLYWLEGAGKASSFYGWLFENLAHENLINGGRFPYTQLERRSQENILLIAPTIGHYQRFTSSLTLEMVFQNVYQMPKSQSFKSIDSYILTNQMLYLFQITTSLNHPVNCAGLVELFVKLELEAKIKHNPRFVQLIFVVPGGMGKSYKRQKLTSGQVSIDNWMEVDVGIIPGIGLVREENLKMKGIYTCSELDARGEDEGCRREFNCLQKFKTQVTLLKELSYLDQIPQYVLEMRV
jgi:hypothetical protein